MQNNKSVDYSNNAGWIFAGVFLGMLAIIVGVLIDYQSEGSGGRSVAAIKGTLIQVVCGVLLAGLWHSVNRRFVSILKKVKELKSANSTLVLGEPAHGKSYTIIQDLLGKKALWVGFANLNGLEAEHCKDWDVAQPVTWEEMKTEVVQKVISGDLKGHDAIVIDGLGLCAGMCLTYISMKDSQEMNAQIDDVITIKQNHWLVMGRTIQKHDHVATYKDSKSLRHSGHPT